MTKMSDCPSPLGTVCKDPACHVHFPGAAVTLPMPNFCYTAKVIRVVDGDTYEVEVDLGFRVVARMPLRLAHVDAPEHNTLDGLSTIKWASKMLDSLPATVVVRTYKPIDKYGRYLADVFVHPVGSDWLDLGAAMVEQGYAKPYEGGKKE